MEPLYWNPPETAPRDRVVLCYFEIESSYAEIATWDDGFKKWMTNTCCGDPSAGFDEDELVGWLPVPLPHDQKPKQETGSAADATHYQRWPLQPIEVMQRAMSPEAFRGFLLGNVIKYQMRAGQKGGQEGAEKDRKKALQYDLWLKMAMKDSARLIDPRKDVVL